MLVLSRKVGEKVVIGSNIVVTVLEVSGSRVRIGFEAPADVAIRRSEIVCNPGPAGDPLPLAAPCHAGF